MKIIVAPDSFKGTLSAAEVANTIAEVLRATIDGIEVLTLPLADGGEGLVDCIAASMGAQMVSAKVSGPLGNLVDAKFAIAGDLAVIEMAEAAGLPLLDKPDVMHATTYGVGELIAAAEDRGAKRILLGLGGSATNDMGCGMAAALGCRFWDGKQFFVPVGGTLRQIKRIDYADPHDVIALCDVKNPLYGKTGAAYVYGPQKGAKEGDLRELDAGLRHVAALLQADGKSGFAQEGAGAAGGLGAGVIAFLGGTLRRGIDAVLDTVRFAELAADADLVITGEGRLDSQSFAGKVIDGVIAHSKCPVVAVVGQADEALDYAAYGLQAVFSTARHLVGDDYKAQAHQTLLSAAKELADWIAHNL